MKHQTPLEFSVDRKMSSSGESRFSVAVCTHNRPHLLSSLLDIIVPQLSSRNIPLIIVDSASSHSSRLMNREIAERWPHAVFLCLDEPGVSRARNAALQFAKTEWLAFIDDDEVPNTHWALDVEALIERLPAECAACGGNVEPIWPSGQVPSIGRRWQNYLSLIDQRGEYNQRASPRFGIGHSVVRIDALRAVGGFDLRLGRDGSSLLSGEEVLLVDRLHHAGWQVWHSDRIRVGHHIEPERLQRTWAVSRAYWEGVSRCRTFSIVSPKAKDALEKRVRKRLLGLRLCAIIARERFEFDLRLAFAHGVLAEAIRIKHSL